MRTRPRGLFSQAQVLRPPLCSHGDALDLASGLGSATAPAVPHGGPRRGRGEGSPAASHQGDSQRRAGERRKITSAALAPGSRLPRSRSQGGDGGHGFPAPSRRGLMVHGELWRTPGCWEWRREPVQGANRRDTELSGPARPSCRG